MSASKTTGGVHRAGERAGGDCGGRDFECASCGDRGGVFGWSGGVFRGREDSDFGLEAAGRYLLGLRLKIETQRTQRTQRKA